MVAIIQTGGKQYCIREGQKLFVERLSDNAGSKITMPDLLNKESVTLEVVAHLQGEKVMTRKFRNKTRYHRVKGHRQALTMLKVVTIGGNARQLEGGSEQPVPKGISDSATLKQGMKTGSRGTSAKKAAKETVTEEVA